MAKADWRTQLVKNKQGAYLPCTSNIALILTHQEEWKHILAYDDFAGDIVTRKVPPWCEDTMPENAKPGDWTLGDTVRTIIYLSREWNIHPTATCVNEAVHAVSATNVFHPVRDWLAGLRWDRKSRLDSVFIRLAGAEDNLYTRAATKNFFIGAVARIIKPGEKVDTMLILEGDQGIGKSTLLRILAGEEWFLETSIDIGSKDGYQALRRKWIVEMGELDSLHRGDISRIKQFLTARKDSYRPSYGTKTIDFPRQSVSAGTVNPDGGGYLKDNTGARRFNPIPLQRIDLKAVRGERDQLWAEAVFRYRQCERWYFHDARTLKAAADETEQRRQTDPWETHFRKWLWAKDEKVWTNGVTTERVLTAAIAMPKDRQGRGEQMRAGQALRAIGWDRTVRGNDDLRRYHPNPETLAAWRKIQRDSAAE